MRTARIGVTVPRKQASALKDYLQRIDEAGGAPVEIAPGDESAALIDELDGLLLPGGGDVEPRRYGAKPHPETYGVRLELDELELRLIELARERELPILAICRGQQIANVAFGGSLLQHIDGDGHRALPNDGPAHQWLSRWHAIRIQPASRLAHLLGGGEHWLNSRHHQVVLPETLAPGLRATAFSPEGFVEGVEADAGPWLVGVQWHPERSEVIGSCRPLFTELVRAAQPAGNPVLR